MAKIFIHSSVLTSFLCVTLLVTLSMTTLEFVLVYAFRLVVILESTLRVLDTTLPAVATV